MPTRPATRENLPTIGEIYRRFGFVDAGCLTRVGYKHDRFVDTTLMQRTLA